MTKDELKSLTNDGATIKFIKKDGSERVMNCITDWPKIALLDPNFKPPKEKETENKEENKNLLKKEFFDQLNSFAKNEPSFAFEKLKLHRLQAGIYASNQGSGRALEKAGYKLEAVFKKQLKNDSGWEDHYFFAALNEVRK